MRPLLYILVLLLIGCAASPSHHQIGVAALNRGDFQSAERELTLAIRDGDSSAWNNLGVTYGKQGRRNAAIDAYKMGARYGDPTARSNLAALNVPIPAADLTSRSTESSTDGLANALDGFNRGYQGGGSVTCTTSGFVDMMRINCR